ncbi:hypothetical protein [Candidatus Entotheonella palauensis]|uniref:hypothetical protein n=1 Tax=Candidatus Entotheonella palauensis TaxID=93172 RepID=UPI000B7C7F94|nr:hypothetical protein [Candidatus Entotheonella palauensis]
MKIVVVASSAIFHEVIPDGEAPALRASQGFAIDSDQIFNNDMKLDDFLDSPEFYADPYPVYHRLRAEDPVHWSDIMGSWILTRYDDVLASMRDSRGGSF